MFWIRWRGTSSKRPGDQYTADQFDSVEEQKKTTYITEYDDMTKTC